MNTTLFHKAALAAATVASAIGILAVTFGAAAPADGAVPGLNGKIAYASYGGASYDIWVMNADGSNRNYLTSSTDWETEPAFSPDGSKIAYVRQDGNSKDVWVMNADGTGQTNLTQTAFPDEDHPAWSPDGGTIAYTMHSNGNAEIFVMNADGSGQTNLTRSLGNDYDATWSPDGSKIAFTSFRDGTTFGEIYVMNADGSGQTNITRTPLIGEAEPSWSPDGSKIAYMVFGSPNQVYVMNADGSGQTNLSHDSGEHPTWSPDGSKIAFTSFRDGNGEIYVMNADGSAQNNLTQLVDEDADPSWQTVPSSDLVLGAVASPTVAKTQKPLEYTFTVSNAGPSNAFGVVVTDVLPPELRFVSASASQGSCLAPPVGSAGTVTCNLGFLFHDQSSKAKIAIKFQARKTSVTDTASVAAATADPNLSNNSVTITTPVR